MMEKKASALKPPEMTRRGFVKASAVAAAGIAGAGAGAVAFNSVPASSALAQSAPPERRSMAA